MLSPGAQARAVGGGEGEGGAVIRPGQLAALLGGGIDLLERVERVELVLDLGGGRDFLEVKLVAGVHAGASNVVGGEGGEPALRDE